MVYAAFRDRIDAIKSSLGIECEDSRVIPILRAGFPKCLRDRENVKSVIEPQCQ